MPNRVFGWKALDHHISADSSFPAKQHDVETGKRESIVAYLITADCVACGGCVDECPHGAIVEGEDDGISMIDPDRCDDCGLCVSSYCCPAAAIVKDKS